MPRCGETALLSPGVLLETGTSEEHSLGAVPYGCSLTPGQPLPRLFPWGRLHVRAYSCSEQMASLRKGEQSAALATSLVLILSVRRECILDPNLTPHIRCKVFRYPAIPRWQEKTGPTSKRRISSRKEPSCCSTIELRGHSQGRQLHAVLTGPWRCCAP